MIGSTSPTAGQLYIVDTFLVVVFGGAASLFGTIASAFTISQTQSTLEFFLSGSMASPLVGSRLGTAAPSAGVALSATGLVALAIAVLAEQRDAVRRRGGQGNQGVAHAPA